MKRILYIICCLLSLAGGSFSQEKIILLNEGNWQADNGRMTYFENGKIVSNQWFRDNNGSKLGDTPNDIIQISDRLIAIAINWSNIVQFITPEGKAVAATEDVPNNRKLASDGQYVYVTSYGHECGTLGKGFYKTFQKGYVAKIDCKTFKVVDAVEVGYEPEGIAYYKGYLFVANSGGYSAQESHDYETTVSVIDANTMKVVRTVDTQQINLFGQMSQVGQYLCINSSGDYYEVQACALIFDCEKALTSANDKDCFVRLPYAATSNTVTRDGKILAVGSLFSYYAGESTFNYITIDPALVMKSGGAEGVTETLPGTVLADMKKISMPYALYVNPYTGYIYATDAASSAEAGMMYQWDSAGKFIGKYKVYINPAHFLALPPDGHFPTIVKTVHTSHPVMSDTYYNILGQRTNANAKGILIRGNKKVMN